jgi:hypothetical protein
LRGEWHAPPAQASAGAPRAEGSAAEGQLAFGPWLALACGDEFELGSTVLCLQARTGPPPSLPPLAQPSGRAAIASTFVPSAKLLAAEVTCQLRLRRAEKEAEKEAQEQGRKAERSRAAARLLAEAADPNPAPRQRRRGVTWASDVNGGATEDAATAAASVGPPPQPGSAAAVAAGVGGAMLRQMGWRGGQGLGKLGDGLAEPVAVAPRARHAGLGAPTTMHPSEVDAERSSNRAYKTVSDWARMRARFDAAEQAR